MTFPASFVRFLPLVILFLAVFFAASAALHHPRPALAKPEPGGEAPASPPPLILRPPTDFVEIKEKNGTLFAENARQLGERARLLRLFLPENQAHFYEEGKHYALTRQLAVYGIAKANDAPFNKDDIALLGRILEEGFLSFDKAPSAALRDSLALEEVLLQAGPGRTQSSAGYPQHGKSSSLSVSTGLSSLPRPCRQPCR